MNMKDMIQRLTDLENDAAKQLNESTSECGMPPQGMPSGQSMSQGTPVSVNLSFNAAGKDHVSDLLDMMKNAGLSDAGPAAPSTMPMRQDMERLSGIMDEPKDLPIKSDDFPSDDDDFPSDDDDDDDDEYTPPGLRKDDLGLEGYENAPDEKYDDHNTMMNDLSGGINKKKKMYKPAAKGDNPMAVESIKQQLYRALSEKKDKSSAADSKCKSNSKLPMKKSAKDKKTAKKPFEAYAKKPAKK